MAFDMMAEVGNASSGPVAIAQNGDTNSEAMAQPSGLSMDTPEDMFEELSDAEDLMVDDISAEDVSSLLEPAISKTATRFKSSKTPAIEKAMVLEENGGYFDEGFTQAEAYSSDENITPKSQETTPTEPPKRPEMSLGQLPSPRILDPEIPITPWQAGPKDLQVNPQPSLQGVFSGRTRSSSGGAEALRRLLPKGLPSMAQIGDFLSSNSPTKSTFGLSLAPKLPKDTKLRKVDRSQASSGSTSPRFESIVSSRPSNGGGSPVDRPGSLRRVNSDDSLLYHSLSRASSLGDDTRFENQREMVNSRVKAIRDSLQDRSSFRMPQMPSIPSMPRVSSFSFNMNFLNTTNSTPGRSRANTDPVAGILPSNITKKKSSAVLDSTVGSSVMGATIARPEAVSENVTPMPRKNAAEHVRSVSNGVATDVLDRALEGLTGDIVVMGGYRGSILRSTKTNRQLWVPVKVGLNIRKVDLEVGLEPEDEEKMHETIYSSGMLQNIGPVDISKRLFKRIKECENARNGKLRVWDYGYDWRLSPHLLSRQLTQFLQKLPSNQPGGGGALVVAHSLGGLITRHVVNHHPELFSGVVYAGVPKSCVNILGPLRNGDAVLLSSRVLTAQVNFTFRTSFVLLPEDGGCFVDINTKEKYPIDLFNVDDWIKYRLSPCTDPALPPRNPQPQGGLGSFLNRSNTLLSLPLPGKKSISFGSNDSSRDVSASPPTKTTRAADVLHNLDPQHDRTLGMQMDSSKSQSTNISTLVTLPRPALIKYLTRTLRETKEFKQQLHYLPALGSSNAYPPLAIIYGKSIPTVSGSKVDGREGIPCSDCYDNLTFGSGDGVCLAREAMLPEGYRLVKGGRISSDRGHVTLLGDLSAVGRAIEAVRRGRERGIGLGGSVGVEG